MKRVALWAVVIVLASFGGGQLQAAMSGRPYSGPEAGIALFFLLTAGAIYLDCLRDK